MPDHSLAASGNADNGRVRPLSGIATNWSLRQKVTLALMGFGSVIVVGLALFAFQSGRSALINATMSDLATAVHEKETALEVWREHRLETLLSLSRSQSLLYAAAELARHKLNSPEAQMYRGTLRRELRHWLGPHRAFESLLILSIKGGSVLFATNKPELGLFKENRPYFLAGLQGPSIFGPFFSVTQGKAIITASAPLRAANGSIIGVLVGRLNMSEIDVIMRRRVGVNRTFDSYLVNTARLFVSQPRDIADRAVLARGVHLPFVSNCLRGASGSALTDDFRGVPVIIAYDWSKKLGLCVIAKLDRDEAIHPIHIFGWITLGGGVLMLLVAAILAFFLAGRFTKPVMRLHAATLAVGAGDTEVRLNAPGNDEIAQLMTGFNNMVSRLGEKDREIENYTGNLETRVLERTRELRDAQAELVRQERLATLGQLGATVSHELRNPLGTIATSLAVIEAKTQAPELGLEGAIERMKRSIARCDRIISEMLDFARDRDLMIVSTDLDRWVAELLDEQTLPETIRLRMHGNAGGAKVEIDPELLRRAVINLVDNARDAMLDETRQNKSGHELTVETRCFDGRAEISVIDTGPGMPAEVRESAFEPLFSTKSFGIGLGLPVVRKIIEQHRGSIEIDSPREQGTRITLKFPQLRPVTNALQRA